MEKLSKAELDIAASYLERAAHHRQIDFGWHTYQDAPYQAEIGDAVTVTSRDIEALTFDDTLSITLEESDYHRI